MSMLMVFVENEEYTYLREGGATMSDPSMIDDIIASDPEMLESFVKESRDCLNAAESDLNYLRNGTIDSDPERLERAFRSVHSLKSAAGFLGLDNVAELALRMETLLGHMRAGTIPNDPNTLDLLLEGLAMLNSMLQDPMRASGISTQPFLARLSEKLQEDANGFK
jgi:two-component system chemotaxis sensor kinase CheA